MEHIVLGLFNQEGEVNERSQATDLLTTFDIYHVMQRRPFIFLSQDCASHYHPDPSKNVALPPKCM